MSANIRNFTELLFAMTEKELRARYKYTIFGFFWLVLNPILQMLVIGFIFQFIIKTSIPYYNFYLFLSLLVWNFFSLSLTKSTPSIVYERSLIKKAKFPRAVIPLAIILSNFIHLMIACVLYLFLIVHLGTLTFWSMPIIIAAFLLLYIFTSGLSLLTSALNVRFRDVNFFVSAFVVIWFYATPIIYSFDFIPNEHIWLWRFNPMVSILQLFQHGMLNFPLPDRGMLISNICIMISIISLGVFVFMHESKNFDDWL